MKYWNYLTAVILLISIYGCSGGFETEENISFTGFDFTEYSQKGFLFTPEAYLGDYEAVGLLSARLTPEVKSKPPMGRATKPADNFSVEVDNKVYYIRNSPKSTWYEKAISTSKVIKSFYEKASGMGANAVMNLKIQYVPMHNGEISFDGVEVSGFAIKRKPHEVKIVEDKK